jgi:hypothetical protein
MVYVVGEVGGRQVPTLESSSINLARPPAPEPGRESMTTSINNNDVLQ